MHISSSIIMWVSFFRDEEALLSMQIDFLGEVRLI